MESEINLMRKNIVRLVENEIKPKVKEWEKDGKIPDPVITKLAEMGIFGLAIPEEEGGIGYGATALTASLEELARGSASVALIVLIQNSLIARILSLSAEKETLAEVIEGGSLGGGGLFDGTFQFQSDRLTGEGAFLIKGTGKIYVLIDREKTYLLKEGIEITPTTDVLAFHSAGIATFRIESVPVVFSVDNSEMRSAIDLYLLGLAAIGLGIGQEILNEAKTYARSRKQFGRPIADFWMVQDMLAEIAISVRTSDLLIRDAASRYDENRCEDFDIPMVKVYTTEHLMKAATLGIQVFGGYGYTTDYPMERYFREAKALEVLGVVNEELRARIARSL
jgi:alkylation response protein AidB-like acyl-CoA dehydrogenase